MSKDRKVRSFDFLKQTTAELPSREEVIQKTAELTGQSTPTIGEETSSVSEPIKAAIAPIVAPIAPIVVPTVTPVIVPVEKTVSEAVVSIVLPVEKEKKEPQKRQKVVEPPPPPVVQPIVEKSKVGRKALVDIRKPFTTTITVDNKRQLRQLCAEHDIAMSDVINEILSAHFEQRTPNF